MAGQSPFVWQLDDLAAHIVSVTPAADDHKLALRIRYQPDPTEDPKQIDDQARALIFELKKARPDYLDGFEALIVDVESAAGRSTQFVEKLH